MAQKVTSVLMYILVGTTYLLKAWGLSLNPFQAEVYMPFDTIANGKLVGGTYEGTFLQSTTASATKAKNGNGIQMDNTVFSIGSRRDSCFWLPDLCQTGFTWAIWIQLNYQPNSEVYLFTNGGHTTHSYGMSLNIYQNKLRVNIKTKKSSIQIQDADINTTTSVDQWFHIALTWNSITNATNYYVNGVLKTSLSVVSMDEQPSTTHNEFAFGGANSQLTNSGYRSKAVLDEFLFWSEIKDSTFIANLFDYYGTDIQMLQNDGKPAVTSGCINTVLQDGLNSSCVDLVRTTGCFHVVHPNLFFQILQIRIPAIEYGVTKINVNIVARASCIGEPLIMQVGISASQFAFNSASFKLQICSHEGTITMTDGLVMNKYSCDKDGYNVDYLYITPLSCSLCEISFADVV